MTPAARIAAQIELLDQMIAEDRPADTIMSAYFRARKFIGSKDRAWVASATYQTLRRWLRLCWHVARAGGRITGRNLVLAELTLAADYDTDAIGMLFSGDRYAPRALTQDEEYFLMRVRENGFEPAEMPDTIKLECPDAYTDKFRAVFGEHFEHEMRAMQTEAPLDLRVNPHVTTRDNAIVELQQNNIMCAATPFSPFGIRVQGRPALPTLDIFKRGGVEIQDEGSQLIAFLLGARAGEAVVDFCAGAGGKTLAIAAQMQNKGRVVACDVLDRRLERARVRFTRAGLDNIQTRALSSENDKWVKRSAGQYDRVLVDAPCSGTGVWRRNPDARWKHLGPGLAELVPLQASILKSAARLVKPGGTLVYATCSLLPDENENQVQNFLAEHTDFKIVPLGEAWSAANIGALPSRLTPDASYLSLTPAQHETDGFFGAVMVKTAA